MSKFSDMWPQVIFVGSYGNTTQGPCVSSFVPHSTFAMLFVCTYSLPDSVFLSF